MTHLAGKKYSKRHTTTIKAAATLAKFLARESAVTKIIIGEIKPIRVGPKRLKIRVVDAGLKLTVRDTSARQTIYIYTKEISEITAKIDKFWAENCV